MSGIGTVFLSHANEDKEYVRRVYSRLDAATVFFDAQTIAAGQATIDAMEKGVKRSSIFVLFHSRHSQKPWVDFEKEAARLRAINHSETRVLVCPLDDETYKTLPDWMKKYWTTLPSYKANDIVRAILALQEELLADSALSKRILVGREDLTRGIELDIFSAPTQVGVPLQHIILAGIPGMGRTTVAKTLVDTSFPGMRPGGPVFDLPDMAEAADVHLRLKQDLDGEMSKDEIERQIFAFETLAPDDQAATLLKSLNHWAELNQVVILRTRWGLRDRTRQLKPWLEALFRLSTSTRNLRLIFVSERKLPAEALAHIKNAKQYEVKELSDQNIQYVLSKKTDTRFFNLGAAVAVSKKVRGHPATAHHVAYLTNSGISLDSMSLNPEPIYAFQDKTLDAIFHSGRLQPTDKVVLTALGWFPKLPISLLTELIGPADQNAFVQGLWDLQDYSLIQQGEGGFYSVPEVVAARIRREFDADSSKVFAAVRAHIARKMKAGTLSADLIDALLIAVVNSDGEIPQDLRKIFTASNLLALVTEQFQTAKSLTRQQHDAFRRVYELSKMAIGMKTSDDAVEQILFTGGDAAIRAGIYPNDILTFMTSKALPSTYYLQGSYAFYIEKDFAKAAKSLSKSVKMKHFRTRNVRLLAKALVRDQKFADANAALENIPTFQLYRDSGLLVLKIRALRGMGDGKGATELEKQLRDVPDEYAEKATYLAGRAIRDNNLSIAKQHIELAKAAAKHSHLSVALLECAVAIEEGDAALLPQTVELALAAGRQNDARQMQARMALKQKDWREALTLLDQIERKDFFDLQLEVRALNLKKIDKNIIRDPAEIEAIEARLQEIAMSMYKSPENTRDI